MASLLFVLINIFISMAKMWGLWKLVDALAVWSTTNISCQMLWLCGPQPIYFVTTILVKHIYVGKYINIYIYKSVVSI